MLVRMRVLCLLLICVAPYQVVFSMDHSQRSVSAKGTSSDPGIVIDGRLDEAVWADATVTTGFTVYDPGFGDAARQQTAARFVYCSYGLYIGLEMFDSAPDSIFTDLSVRDDMGNADWAGIILSPSNDGQNGFRFQVSAAGVQYDAKIVNDRNDVSWDAVWFSAVSITETGWVAEILIPWSAIRFDNTPDQHWDMNLIREVRRFREQSTWNPVNRQKHGFLTQSGKLTGLKGLQTPVRLTLLPYASGYLQRVTGQDATGYTFRAGMDVKYGIKNNYTLDITLIPDFGQVQSDEEVYNFSPDEIRYQENRPFFTEGTELFDKSGLFYTRRIGQQPVYHRRANDSLHKGEVIKSNPYESRLLNASKFSGRNSRGFAVGIFNAVTGPVYAVLEDTATGMQREISTQPLTNYSMVVLDQTIRNNSHIHFANTNLIRRGFVANVSAASFELKDATQRFSVSGSTGISRRSFSEKEAPLDGYRYGVSAGKISGNLRWRVSHNVIGSGYDPNDMGYLARNNRADLRGEVGYHQFTPIRNMLNYSTVLSANYNMLHEDFRFTDLQLNLRASTTYRNRLSVGSILEVIPTQQHDYYEARIPGRVFHKPGHTSARVWFSPDYRKRFLADVNLIGWRTHDTLQQGYTVSVSPRIRLNTRSLIIMQAQLNRETPSKGFVSHELLNDSAVVLFGERDISNLTLSMTGNYIVSPTSAFSLRIRHYWVTTLFSQFFLLNESGGLNPIDYSVNRDFSVNFFTVDFEYSWNFAPGSFLHLVYKNSLNNHTHNIHSSYLRNWEDLLDFPALNSISLRLIYHIDYETTRRRLKPQAT